MFNKITAGYQILMKGRAVADIEKWKGRQVKANTVVALLWALIQGAESFLGVALPIDEASINEIAVGILAVVNWYFTLATSEKVGPADSVRPSKKE